jgi:cysteine-rich repeat protein
MKRDLAVVLVASISAAMALTGCFDWRIFASMGSDADVDGGGDLCGNGRVDPGEVCDDQNTDENDGCNNTCTVNCSDADYRQGDHCYRFLGNPPGLDPNWFQAEILCEDLGMTLIVPDSQDDVDALMAIYTSYEMTGNIYFWLGAHDQTEEAYDDSSLFDLIDGSGGEIFGLFYQTDPNDEFANEDCLVALVNGRTSLMVDLSCESGRERLSVCEGVPARSTPRHCGNGSIEEGEVCDTASIDGARCNEVCTRECPDTSMPIYNSCYILSSSKMSWEDGSTFCQSVGFGMHRPTTYSSILYDEESEEISAHVDEMEAYRDESIWIGLHSVLQAGVLVWAWDSGVELDPVSDIAQYLLDGQVQPAASGLCVADNLRNNSLWEIYDCTEDRYVFCEYE